MWQAIAGFAGNVINAITGQNAAAQNRKDQMDIAKNQVQYRVADANKAGVNPLAALGMNPINLAPTAVGTDLDLEGAGAAVDRAAAAGSTRQQQSDLLTARLLDAQITGAELDNDIKRAELASFVRRTAGAPGMTAVPGISVDGVNRTVDHPVYGKVTRQGMAAGDLTEEIGELGDWMEGANYVNEWFREHTGAPIISESDLEQLGAVAGWMRDPFIPTGLGRWYVRGGRR